MANKLSELKKKSGSAKLNELRKRLDEDKSGGGSNKDERIWTPFLDKEKGTGFAKVRLLPAPQGEDLPWVKVFTHKFKGPTGKWYMENCLSTIGQPDPVNDINRKLWNSGIDSDKGIARNQKRKVEFYSNVEVIKDPANPDNEGKVFLFKYGTQIQKIIEDKIRPQFEDEEPADPFDFWEGCNLNIKMVAVELNGNQVPNYEKSYFDPASEHHDGDEDKLQEVWDKCYSLSQFIDPENFRPYKELQDRLFEVLGPTVGSGIEVVEGGAETPKQKPAPEKKETPNPVREAVDKSSDDSGDDTPDDSGDDDSVDMSTDDDMDDDLSFFESLEK